MFIVPVHLFKVNQTSTVCLFQKRSIGFYDILVKKAMNRGCFNPVFPLLKALFDLI